MSNPENKKAQEIPDENKADKKPKLPPEKLQNIVGVAVIGVITIALCLCGIFGGDDVKNSKETSANSSSVSSDSSEQTQSDATTATTSATETEPNSSSEDTVATTTTTTTQSSTPETTTTTTKKEDKTTTTTTTTSSSKVTTTTTTTEKTTTTTTTTKKQSQSGKLTASAKISNSWQDADGFYAQLDVSAKNNTSKDVEGWTIKISVPSGTEISSSWNGDFKVSGGYIIVKPADYNGTIGAGSTLSDIGLIVKTTGEFTPKATIE